MEIGIDSFAAFIRRSENGTTLSGAAALNLMVDRIALADQLGIDFFGVGEHHRQEFLDSAPVVILAAAAARTSRIRLTSAVTVLSAIDPVRAFQSFATLDLISAGRAEMVVGRGSFVEAFPLFGHDLKNYDELFAENLDLLLTLRANEKVHWSGKFRAPLTGQGVYPRPAQPLLPVWLGVGGTPQSFVRAGVLGLPLMVAIIGGQMDRFKPLIDLYREVGERAGHSPGQLKVGLHCLGYVAENETQAANDFYPGYAQRVNTIGRERGWPPASRAQFDTQLGADGAFLIGSPDMIAQKLIRASEALGGIDRVMFQMDNENLPHDKLVQSLELIATRVAPQIRPAHPLIKPRSR